ncbi:hypothetical protein BDY19DRAFT_991426 [Irpex rosettiformis]|uniref:Uncharacterized protein n=1 Tax=Irpex rosettiformis TaxID=378272 RepID=A0ACB8UBZ3_9APHY|nr:hypothetical protein BDY19DRAFT_991426 [Irpex rosettiformis]
MQDDIDTTIPFSFFVSLLEAIASIRPRKSNETSKKTYKDIALRKLDNWIAELHRQYSPLPPGTTAVFFRLLFPEEDMQRKYGVQEKKLCDYLHDIFSSGARGMMCEWDRVLQVQGTKDTTCFGERVKRALEAMQISNDDSLSIHEVDALLTDLASNCAFSAYTIRQQSSLDLKNPNNAATKRGPRTILRTLYTSISPSSSGFLTQILLKDLRPILYPITETHYTTSLLQYDSNAVGMLSKEDVMRAWDRTGGMLRMFKVRASLWDAAYEFERERNGERGYVEPKVGVLVQIPKCIKGHSCKDALNRLRKSKRVWVETKYDGERAQIHVEVDECGKSRITIFSKSKRDSTMDRYGVHHIIREALGLSEEEATENPKSLRHTPRITANAILEAEMVAFSDTLDKVDEFWRIRSLIASTAKGVRHRPRKPCVEEEDSGDASQLSLASNASDSGTRHLALVFFDILLLDSNSLLRHPYAMRRSILENLVILKHGYSMLAERTSVDNIGVADSSGLRGLERVFARLLSRCEEGAVVKAEEGVYGGWGLSSWIKLKKDYIPGYGDCVDLALIGAGWDKDRAAELRVSSSVYTTFYFGALANPEDFDVNNLNNIKPHFTGIFTASYGLDREKLEELNFLIRSSDPVECRPSRKSPLPEMSYTLDFPHSLTRPSVLLQTPLLAELYGAGFTKAPGRTFYELRFPRLSKIHRPSERSWRPHTLSHTAMQMIARESVGRDKSTKDVEDWCDELWGKPRRLGVCESPKRREREEDWVERLEVIDGVSRVKKRKVEKELGETEDTTAKVVDVEDEESVGMRRGAESVMRARTFGSVTNMIGSPELLGRPTSGLSLKDTPKELPCRKENTDTVLFSVKRSGTAQLERATPKATLSIVRSPNSGSSEKGELTNKPYLKTLTKQLSNSPFILTPTLSTLPPIPPSTTSTLLLPPSSTLRYTHTPLAHFLSTSVVWLFRPTNALRPSWRVPTNHIIPPGHQVHSFDAFVLACGWFKPRAENNKVLNEALAGGTETCGWAERGVLFVDVDDSEGNGHGKEWVDGTLKRLVERRAGLLRRGDEERRKGMKTVFVFSMRTLGRDEVEREGDVESRALCRLG